MTNKTESRKLTDDYYGFALEEFKTGNLTEWAFCKVMMQIACEYLIEHSDEEASLVALNKVPESYFTSSLKTDMESDMFFKTQMAEFAYHLERRGITFEAVIKTTQAIGEA